MNNKASITALMSAFARAYHAQENNNPIFNDTIARRLMTDEEYFKIEEYIKSGIDFFAPDKKDSFKSDDEMLRWIVETQLAPTPIARARFCEDSLRTAVMTGTSQYVILGAGLDTFAFREKQLMKNLTVFEVDHPMTQEDKKKRLERAGLEIPSNLKLVALDFNTDSLKEKLIKSGFDKRKKTFFSWLGVSYYLSGEKIEVLLSEIYSFAAEGSTLIFDFADAALMNSKVKRVQNMLAMAAAGGEPMKFCIDEFELELMLERHNFLIYELLTSDDIQTSYFYDRHDYLSSFEHISYALAVFKGAEFRDTKENILSVALKLFAQKGYDAVSVRDISGKLGITQAALYKHYKSKRDIFDKILVRMEDNYSRHMNNDSSSHILSLEELKSYMSVWLHYWTEDEFAADFRRMITVEQYKSTQMSELYNKYLILDMTDCAERVFKSITDNTHITAISFYAPVYMMIQLYDSEDDKKKILDMADKYISQFSV